MIEELLPPQLGDKVENAITSISRHDGVVVALSAGVDSSLVALLARKALGDRSVAVTALSESLPPGELEIAENTAQSIGIRHIIVRTDEIHNPSYSSNPSNRCFYCKDTLYNALTSIASSLGFETLLDGTQKDDLTDDRPGFLAARNYGVKSPLLEAGFSKRDVRDTARALGLSVWDKPAMPCLSSRIPHGEEVTEDKLRMVGQAELFIKNLTQIRELRVRYHNGSARVEVAAEERHLILNQATMDMVNRHLRGLGFASVTIDPRGYRRKEPLAPVGAEMMLPMAEGNAQ
jgi:pyridinium-3,5-biscarboxylic acid mononucleotide sulfurtransferase